MSLPNFFAKCVPSLEKKFRDSERDVSVKTVTQRRTVALTSGSS